MACGLAVFLDFLFYGMWVPLIPTYVPAARDSGQAGWVVTTYSVGVLLCPVVFALCAGRLTHARALFAGAVLRCAALALLAGGDATGFAAGRVLQGLASGLTWSAAFAFLSLRYPARGATAITWAGTAGSVGYAIGPVIST